MALTCYSTMGNRAPEAGSAIPPGRSFRAVVSVHPSQTQQVAPPLQAAHGTLNCELTEPGPCPVSLVPLTSVQSLGPSEDINIPAGNPQLCV